VLAGRRRGADVGFGCRPHPDEAGQRRGQGAEEEGGAGTETVLHRQQHCDHEGENTDFRVLSAQIGHSA